MMRILSHPLVVFVALTCLGLSPQSAWATLMPPEPAAQPERSTVEPMDATWAAIRDGDAHVAAAQFDLAVKDYHVALERLANKPEWAVQFNSLRRLLADAYWGSYRIHGRAQDLRRARELLVSYRADLGVDSALDSSSAKLAIADIDAELQRLRDQAKLGAQSLIGAPLENPAELQRHRIVRSPADRQLLSGVIISGVGFLAIIPALTGLAQRNRRLEQSLRLVAATAPEDVDSQRALLASQHRSAERMATMALASTLVGSATLVTGVVVSALGLAKGGRLVPRRRVIDATAHRGGGSIGLKIRY